MVVKVEMYFFNFVLLQQVSESELHGDNAWDKWFIMMMIGIVVGTIGFLVKSATAIIFTQKYKLVEHFIEEKNFLEVWNHDNP